MSLEDKIRKGLSEKPIWRPEPELLTDPHGIPGPMFGLAPRVVLGEQWWNLTREAAYRSTGYHCLACGVHKYQAREHQWLEGHEVYSIDYLLGRMEYLRTVPLCYCCHAFIHRGRLKIMVSERSITKRVFNIVMRHGAKVLRQAKLEIKEPYVGVWARWEDWRLVVDGKEYQPLQAPVHKKPKGAK